MQPQQPPNAGLTASVLQAPVRKTNLLKRLSSTVWSIGFQKKVLSGLVMMFFFYLGYSMASPYQELKVTSGLSDKERLDYREKARGTNLQLLIALATNMATVTVALFSISNSQRTTSETLKLTHQGQVADRFTKATELLSSELPYNQLAGITSLGLIGTENEGYRESIIGVLAAFVRKKCESMANLVFCGEDLCEELPVHEYILSNSSTQQSEGLQALLTLLQLRGREQQVTPPILYLNNVNLSFMDLVSVPIQFINFLNSDLREAFFDNSDLTGSKFIYSRLRQASFGESNLERVEFIEADITNSNFSTAKNLTWEQLLKAKSTGGTKLPDDLLDSPDRPKDFDRDFYDRHGWMDTENYEKKKAEGKGSHSGTPSPILLPPLPRATA